jgi:hypothetical protein
MKAGRPSYHVQSKWVTVASPQGLLYFALDDKGNLVKGKDRELRPDHIGPLVVPGPALPARSRKAAKPRPAEVVTPIRPDAVPAAPITQRPPPAPAAPAPTPFDSLPNGQPNLFDDDDFFSLFRDDFSLF